MSEDRLDKALEAITNENVDAGELAGAHDRVWEKLAGPGKALCVEFQTQFRGYLDGKLDGSRRLLMEDHLSRCPKCRAALASQKGERTAAVMPMRRASRWPQWGTWAAAAAILMGVLYFGRSYMDTLLALGSPRATVASVSGKLYRVPQGVLEPGATIGENEVVRTGPGSRAVLTLADGSRMHVNERTELSVHAAWSGRVVNLQRGDVIIHAAKQHHGYLRVQTRDSLASVKGTIFAVSSGLSGTLVSVVEGSVAVAQLGSETLLSPGEQAASNQALISSVPEAIAWSPDAETYLGILASLAHIEKQIAGLPSPALRTQSQLLRYLPPNTVIYGAVPNFGNTISQAMGFADQQSAENPAFGQWWNSSAGRSLKQLLAQVETVTHLFGDEIVYGYSQGVPGSSEKLPMIFAEVRTGKKEDVTAALNALAGQMGASALPYQLTDTLLVLSDSPKHLLLLLSNLGQGGETPFAQEIAARYQRGAGWLLGMDIESILSLAGGAGTPGAAGSNFVGAHQTKHLFLERRDTQGTEENAMTVTFKGPRMGMASFLANSGSGGAAEYLPGEVIAAGYASTREPKQMFEEMLALATRSDPSVLNRLAQAESALGVSLSNDLAASIGTESAIGVESISTKGPVWVMATLVNNPATLDTSIRRLVQGWNAESEKAGRPQGVTIEQETTNGRTWMSMKSSAAPLTMVYTYDRGYLVTGSDRAAVLRAIATRNGGSPLVWSQEFQQQLSGQAGLHPSGFAWLNTKGAFQSYAALVPNPAIRNLITGRVPILVVFSATEEQIRAVSRTRLSGLIMDMMMLQSLSRMQAGS
jgi:hypothetical protein